MLSLFLESSIKRIGGCKSNPAVNEHFPLYFEMSTKSSYNEIENKRDLFRKKG